MMYSAANKKRPPADWHPAKVVYLLRLQGWSLRRLSRAQGWNPTSLGQCFQRPWKNGEDVIAHTLGVEPWDIWPSRYLDGVRISRHRRRSA